MKTQNLQEFNGELDTTVIGPVRRVGEKVIGLSNPSARRFEGDFAVDWIEDFCYSPFCWTVRSPLDLGFLSLDLNGLFC